MAKVRNRPSKERIPEVLEHLLKAGGRRHMEDIASLMKYLSSLLQQEVPFSDDAPVLLYTRFGSADNASPCDYHARIAVVKLRDNIRKKKHVKPKS